MTETELAAKIAEAGGEVFIGFKEAGAVGGVDDSGRVLASAATIANAKAVLQSLGINITIDFDTMPMVVARMPAAVLVHLRQNPLVEYVEPIFPGTYNVQQTTWNIERVRAPEVWPSSTGSGAIILIADSGIDNPHPDLAPTVVQACDGSDGIDRFGHGTGVIGIAAAVNNDVQHIGAAYDVSLWSSRIGERQPNAGFAACAVNFGRTFGANVINLSITVQPHTGLTDQINAAYYQNGLVIVAAAGNTRGGAVTYPATLAAAIAVSATDTNNNFASFSASGAKVEIAAPGTTVTNQRGITSTCLGDISCAFVESSIKEGTSFAAPHVAAAAALLKAYNPSWSNVEIRQRLQVGATDLGPAGRDAQFGYGLLNIPASIAALLVNISGLTTIHTAGNYSWTCNASGGGGGFSYQWERSDAGGGYYWVGSSSSYSSWVDVGSGPYFDLRCTVTSGTQTVADDHRVNVIIPP